MEKEVDNIKDIGLYIKDSNLPFSYKKTKKLITALFMVTDIMDIEEPIRNKLRSLGIEIISDNYSLSLRTDYVSLGLLNKISQVLSFIDIASDVQLISEMNSKILKKEFLVFKESIEDSVCNTKIVRNDALLELFKEDDNENETKSIEGGLSDASSEAFRERRKLFTIMNPNGHKGQTQRKHNGQNVKVGVQKGNTLMRALRDIEKSKTKKVFNKVIDISKDERKQEIISILKDNPKGLTISEIKGLSKGQLSQMSGKTLQRELVSLVSANILNKTGQKRWSRYLIKK